MHNNIHTFFHSVPELITAQARAEGFCFAQEMQYPSHASADLLRFDGAKVEWKQTHPDGSVHTIFRFDDGMLDTLLRGELFSASAYAVSDEKAAALLDSAKEQIPRSEFNDDEVEITFWRRTLHGRPACTKRMIECPSWHDIKDNYVEATRSALEKLLATNFDTAFVGKIVLWHGEPGTGKTFALRSWGRMCKDLIDINFIVDPEVFFGGNTEYMLEVLTGDSGKKWKLFVAEDTGELLAKDAKRSSGQALSRLLNICDGLIGQGLRILILITTNEELGALHPAIVRPGRCYANIGFEAFNESEAHEWLGSRGVEGKSMPSTSTIAQLYSEIENKQIVTQKPKTIGFVA
ncbi:MAG: DUF5925 domain-containing protein [Thermoleophilia bacterium]